MKYPDITLGRVEAVWNKIGGEDAVDRFLRDELIISEAAKPAPEPEVVLDPIVHVDRSVRPSYPNWVATVMHPELENVGPGEYDITKAEKWLHHGQGKWIEGNKIYAYLKETGDFKNHYTLRDLEEIQERGIAFFRKYFAGKAVFAWGSVVRDRHGGLSVPYLYEIDGGVVLDWRYLDCDGDSGNPGLRHAS